MYISLPKKYMASLAQHYNLDHGLLLMELNPCINDRYLQAYFREWGTVTSCKIKKNPNSGNDTTMAFVMFSTEKEADKADWAGPHYIGGTEVKVKRFVCNKTEEDSNDEMDAAPAKAATGRPVGLGYLLEDAQWLEDEMN
ncbi:heterogeneous nuclear ribonucleoprotein A1-like isoform X2 [Leuresthes tenuis]|uniref:heterogeneous nuclear ribonucleoprotein A1-like isoform X2 n=1 Tax=Leuresthes tenuis TaxID=355514 RepID=UPI003B50A5BA